MHLVAGGLDEEDEDDSQKAPYAARCRKAPSEGARRAAETNAIAIRGSSTAARAPHQQHASSKLAAAKAPRCANFMSLLPPRDALEFVRAAIEHDVAVISGANPKVFHPLARRYDTLAGDDHAFIREAIGMIP